MNRPITSNETELLIFKNFQQTKVQDKMSSQVNCTKHLRKS